MHADIPYITLSLSRSARPMTIELDETDWRILRELQADGRITNIEIKRSARLR